MHRRKLYYSLILKLYLDCMLYYLVAFFHAVNCEDIDVGLRAYFANGTERNAGLHVQPLMAYMYQEQKNNRLVCTRLVEPPRACVFIIHVLVVLHRKVPTRHLNSLNIGQ